MRSEFLEELNTCRFLVEYVHWVQVYCIKLFGFEL